MTTVGVRERRERTVAGLCVRDWPGTGPTVVGLAGLGSSGEVWSALAAALPDHRIVAPDLRGRGGSAGVRGEHGLRAHGRDVAAVAEALDLRDVVVVGHSMGAYLAPVAAQALGDRVERLVLVDGGVPGVLPRWVSKHMTRLSWRLLMARGARTWPGVEAFAAATIGKQIGVRTDLLPMMTDWLRHEVAPAEGGVRPVLDTRHAIDDAVEVFHGTSVEAALAAMTVPAHAVLAEHKYRDSGAPFISDAAAKRWADRVPLLTTERVSGTNHITVLVSDAVVRAVGADPA